MSKYRCFFQKAGLCLWLFYFGFSSCLTFDKATMGNPGKRLYRINAEILPGFDEDVLTKLNISVPPGIQPFFNRPVSGILMVRVANECGLQEICSQLAINGIVIRKIENVGLEANRDCVIIYHGDQDGGDFRNKANYLPLPHKETEITVSDFKVKLKLNLRNEPAIYPEPEKIFAVSDVEGELVGFKKLLIANEVMNSRYDWTFGKGHLVIDGDLFDRGEQVSELLWTLYDLEDKAKAKGGYVHVILGNHDIMNLSGDFRFVKPKYFELAKLIGIGYQKMFSANTELGRWLRTKNIMEKIGDKLYVHGGISPEALTTGKTIEEINEQCRPYYDVPKTSVPDSLKIFFGKSAPFWYRGYFQSPRASLGLIDSTLKHFGCNQIVVGHTILLRNIAMYYGGKVIAIDEDWHLNHVGGAMYEKSKWQVVNSGGTKHALTYKPENDVIKDSDIL